MSNRLSGLSSLSYQGTNAAMPPNMWVFNRAPTNRDYLNFQLGDYWLYRVSTTVNDSELYVLMGVAQGVANWILLSNNTGSILSLTGDSGGAVLPIAGNINIINNSTTGLSFDGSGSTLNLNVTSGDFNLITLQGDTGGTVTANSSYNITINGNSNQGIFVAGNNATNTLTINAIAVQTFTPILSFGGLSTGITYSFNQGIYSIFGNFILYNWRITLTSKGTATGSMAVSGFPNLVNTRTGAASIDFEQINFDPSTEQLFGSYGLGSGPNGNFYLFSAANASGSVLTSDDYFNNNTVLEMTGTIILE